MVTGDAEVALVIGRRFRADVEANGATVTAGTIDLVPRIWCNPDLKSLD